MSDAGSISPTEAKDLRRRRAVAQGGVVIFFVAAIAAMLELGYDLRFEWIGGCIPGAALCLALHVRGVRCPRCRNSVFGPNVDDNTHPGNEPGIGPRLPEKCLSCGVRLMGGQ